MSTHGINQRTSFIDIPALARFLENLSSTIVRQVDGKGLSSNDFTNERVADLKEALEHARERHAPSSAQENIIERILVNSVEQTVREGKSVHLSIPRNLSNFTNDMNFLTRHPIIPRLDNIDNNRNLVYGGMFRIIRDLSRDLEGHVTRLEFETLRMPNQYIHPNSPVSAGTYHVVTVDSQGHIVSGSNPSSRDDFGLFDVPTIDEVDAAIHRILSLHNNLKRTIVTSLPAASSADVNTIYWIRSTSPTAPDNLFDEWIVVEGKWERIGDTRQNLTGYIHVDNIRLATSAEIQALFNK